MEGVSATLDRLLDKDPPERLYHYTSPVGLVGIARTKEVWATNVCFFNDPEEIGHAVDMTRRTISRILEFQDRSPEEVQFLKEVRERAASASRRYYVFSLSEKHDLLSQWRAYCPSTGGYSIGFPTSQLQAVAKEQEFRLVKCEYDLRKQEAIVSEIVEHFMRRFREKQKNGQGTEDARSEAAYELSQFLASCGSVMKHPCFKEEHEWRLVSGAIAENHERIDFREGDFSVVPYYRFRLETERHPDCSSVNGTVLRVIVGPTRDLKAATMAVQFLNTHFFDGAGHGTTEIPYRAG